MLSPAFLMGVINIVALLGASIVPFYLAARTSQHVLRNFSVLFGLFTLVHGLYHLVALLGYFLVAHFTLDSLSIIMLIAFGIYYSKRGD